MGGVHRSSSAAWRSSPPVAAPRRGSTGSPLIAAPAPLKIDAGECLHGGILTTGTAARLRHMLQRTG